MKFAIIAEVAIVALVGFLTLSSAANAAPTSKECWTLANTVKSRIDSTPNASTEAVERYRAGSDACARGFTKFGVAQLEAAMKALGG